MSDHPRPIELEFSRIRDSLGVPSAFPEEVLAAAQEVQKRVNDLEGREDHRHIPFVTIDPAESRDLDQAFYAERSQDGYTVYYAIADVAHFVDRGSILEEEAWRRGVTLYSPDLRTPLYPPALSEGAASLLPDVERPCVLFILRLDKEARHTGLLVRRAVIKSRAKLSYEGVGAHLRAERKKPQSGPYADREWAGVLPLLEEIGRKRQRLEVERGGVSLPIKTQHVRRSSAALTGYHLTLRSPNDVEDWNAQISLLTGMASAQLMLEHGIGILRVLDPPREDRVEAARLTALALGVPWPEEFDYAEFIRSLDPTNPVHTAVMYHASGVMGGARYVAFEGEVPEGARHAAIASDYAHVTAPLRRLADRYALELLVALSQGEEPSPALREVLPRLPPVMQAADRLSRTLEAAMVDFAEARLLLDRVGEVFDALAIRIRSDHVTVQLTHPPVRTTIPTTLFATDGAGHPGSRPRLSEDRASLLVGQGQLSLGQRLKLRLVEVNLAARQVSFVPLAETFQAAE